MTDLHESVGLRFRGKEATLPLMSVAVAMRRTPARTARAFDILVHGLPEDRASATSDESPELRPSHRGEEGGGYPLERPDADGPDERRGPRTTGQENEERTNDEGSPRPDADPPTAEALARTIAWELDDMPGLRSIERLVRENAREHVLEALRRAREVRPDRVRRSRAAIFTAIVRTLARDAPRPDVA